MSLASKLLSSAGGGVDKLFSDDVFQAFTRTGTGADVTVTTGIDMTKGYMLWSKGRSGATDHAIYDSARGLTYDLASNTTAAQTTQATGLKSVSATGHTIGSLGKMNTSGATYVDFVIRKAPKFFDVVTVTKTAGSNAVIYSPTLGTFGMAIIKRTDAVGQWYVTHKDILAENLVLNTVAAKVTSTDVVMASWFVSLLDGAMPNGTYVAYLFAHDPSADGIIQCGSFTTDGGGNATVTLGWEPQWILMRRPVAADDWYIVDTSRGCTDGGTASAIIRANASTGEQAFNFVGPTATGMYAKTGVPNATYIYLAIRRPNKPPTTGTEVYNASARTGTGAAVTVTGVGFAPDLAIGIDRAKAVSLRNTFEDRLRGATQVLTSDNTNAEAAIASSLTAFGMDGVTLGTDNYYNGASPYINHFFKRAPGFFDVVCYTGTGVARTVPHNLGVVPELMIVKNRTNTDPWAVYSATVGIGSYALLNSAASFVSDPGSLWNGVAPTANVFSVGIARMTNSNVADTHVAYLFASKPGISKVGSYTGNGTSQTIDCGFTTGARFVMIKRTDSTGDWYIWDTSRGLVAGNDPHMSLNSTTSEITTDDSLDPASVGFIVNQLAATNINVTSASYIYLSFA